MTDVALVFLFIAVLTLLQAVFVAAEIALVSIRRSRVEQLVEENASGARRMQRLVSEPGRFLAVSQIGLTFIGFFASAFAAVNLADRLRDLFEQIPALHDYAAALALLIVTAILSLFTIVFGELVPKTLALAHPEAFAIALSGPIDVIGRILSPLVRFLTWTTRVVAGAFGANVNQEARISAEELMLIVERGGEQGVLEAEEEQMIHAVIGLGDRRVHEVMVPRIAVAALASTASMDEAIETIVAEGHSRIPVYEESIDEVVGILYAKDLLPYLRDSAGPRPYLRALLRTPLFVPESMSVDNLLHEFQRRKVHIAVILDEYGGTAGIVTIEDLLEEIVGEIQDEYDVEEPMVERLSDDEARVDGRAAVDELGDLFDTELELEDEAEYDTVGGLIYHRVGGIPSPGDRVEVDGLVLTVETVDGRRVDKVLVVRRRPEDEDAGAADEAHR